jgi:peroxiredoxin/mono/diheme cytochrome c family protein
MPLEHRPMRRTLIALVALSLVGTAVAADPSTDKINKKIDRVALTTLDGVAADLSSAAGKKATVVVFLSFDCPVSNSYAAQLGEMAKGYGEQGVAFVGVLPTDDPLDGLKKSAAEFKLGFPVYADPKLTAADAFKAAHVPEAFVLDHNAVLRYRGRIDDGWAARLRRNNSVTAHDLKAAVDDLLAGRDVKVPVTTAVGCPVGKREVSAQTDAAVTYYKDVLPVLQANCQSCHRQGQVGPFSLMTYKQAVNWAEDMKDYTRDRRMPPWKPVGGMEYANTRRMKDKDIETIAAWVDAGCPEGNKADAPPPARFSDEWQLGKPDLVLEVPEEFHVGPAGKDLFRCFVLPTGLTEDKYIVAYEVKPGNPRVVHHTLNFWDSMGKGRELAEAQKAKDKPGDPDRGPGYSVAMGLGFVPAADPKRPGVATAGAFGGWAPGQLAGRVPDGSGFFIGAGADVVVQTHYHRTGKPEVDRLKLGLYFAKGKVERPFQSIAVGGLTPFSSIPAGKPDHAVKGSMWLLQDAKVHNVLPHMHLIGKKIKVTMTPPGGEPVTLVAIDEWDYNWQETYWLKAPLTAPAGTRLDVEAVYDNSLANPNNPFNPPRRIHFGEQTTNEMLFGFVGITPVGEGRVRISRTEPKLPPPEKKGPDR